MHEIAPRNGLVGIETLMGWANDQRLNDLYAFWQVSRGQNAYPAQSDLDLVAIPKLLPNLFIIDAEGPRDFRYRYMGSKVDEIIGKAVTGQLFSDFRTGRTLEELIDFFRRMIERHEMGVIRTRLPSETHDWMIYLRAGIPIADDHVTPNKVIGFISAEGHGDLSTAPTLVEAEQSEFGLVEKRYASIIER